MTDCEALIALNLIPDIGSQRLKNLLEAFGSAPKVFLNSENNLRRVDKIGANVAKQIASFPFEKLKEELELCGKLGIKIITLIDDDYPRLLKDIYDPPLCLYVKGALDTQNSPSLGIVGSRRASYYGLSCAEKFAYSLAKLAVVVVSGMARGVDTYAHKGALKAGGLTYAVLGSGLNNIYPPENKDLYRDIAESGAVISEFPLNTPPIGRNFPCRNRIISGLSNGVIVVEAAKNSGALITADFALEQGREVFAIPGKVDSATSYGTNHLIKQGAKLIDSVEDIIEELGYTRLPEENSRSKIGEPKEGRSVGVLEKRSAVKAGIAKESSSALSEEERLVYGLIPEEGSYIDELIEGTGLATNRISSLLLGLEIRNIVKQLPGKKYMKAAGRQ